MMKLVALVGHRHRVDDLAKSWRGRLYSITASASGFEKSGLSNKVYAKLSGGASIASFGDAWKVGSGLIVIGVPPYLRTACRFTEQIRFMKSETTSPEIKVELARLVPRAVTNHEIIRDDKIVRTKNTIT